MGMFNNIYTNVGIYKQVFTIPEANVQTMDSSAPYTLINTNNEFFAIPLACYVHLQNSANGYAGFVHLHLTSISYSVTELIAVLSANSISNNQIEKLYIYSMLINCQQAGYFGGVQSSNNLEIFFDTIPTAGDGDMVVTLFYTKNNIF